MGLDMRYVVEWLSEDLVMAEYRRRCQKAGHDPEDPNELDSLWDWVEMDEPRFWQERRFPNLAMAKGWAAKNHSVDMYNEPRIYAQRRNSDGNDWETVEQWVAPDGDLGRVA